MANLASSQHPSSWVGSSEHGPKCQQTLRPWYRGQAVAKRWVRREPRKEVQLFGSTSGWDPWVEVQPPVCCLGAVVFCRPFHRVEVWGLIVTHRWLYPFCLQDAVRTGRALTFSVLGSESHRVKCLTSVEVWYIIVIFNNKHTHVNLSTFF